jgi:hypothetical protein
MGAVVLAAMIAGMVVLSIIIGCFACDEMSDNPNHHHHMR